jgi:hypothetical protein
MKEGQHLLYEVNGKKVRYYGEHVEEQNWEPIENLKGT